MGELGKLLIEALLTIIGNIITGYGNVITALGNMTDLNSSTLTTITNSIGQTLTSLFFVMEAFKEVSLSRFETLEDAVKLMFRFVIAKVIIENSSGIVAIIYTTFFKGTISLSQFSNDLTSHITNSLSISITNSAADGGFLGIGYILSALILLIIIIMIIVMLTKLVIQLMGIIFEIGVHMCVAPIALSTLCNDTARSTGIAFIKSFSAVCMQVMVMDCLPLWAAHR